MASNQHIPSQSDLSDAMGRAMRDLRISVTDRCNLRCTYCMPADVYGPDHPFLPRAELLTYEEIARMAAVFADLGVTKLRITGGEPLLRRDLDTLVSLLRRIPAIEDIALTTNGLLLPQFAPQLKAAGLNRLSVSLDSVNPATFGVMNGRGVAPQRVLEGIAAAESAGFTGIKINMVVERGVNDGEVVEMARHFRGTGHIVRFIEFMDVGTTNGWRLDRVLPGREVVRRISEEMPLEPVEANYPGEVARRWRYADGSGEEIGVITSVTAPFCGGCTRGRLSARGELFTCLFAGSGTDLRELLRSGATHESLARFVANVWRARSDRYSELRTQATDKRDGASGPDDRVEMSYIGG